MARPVTDFELDPLVVPITDEVQGDFDDWLSTLMVEDEPLHLGVSAAELVAGARDDERV